MIIKLRHIALIAALLVSGFSITGVASAQPASTFKQYKSMPSAQSPQRVKPRVETRRYAQRKISYAQAKSIARRHIEGAQVVDIALDGNTYRVRMERSDGRVVDVYIDAVTGRVR